MAKRKKVVVKKPTDHHELRVLGIIPVFILGVLYTITIKPLLQEDSLIWNSILATTLGCIVGGFMAYFKTDNDGVLTETEKQQSITTGVLVFVGTMSFLMVSTVAPQLQLLYSSNQIIETIGSVFETEKLKSLVWNMLLIIGGYIGTMFSLMYAVPAIGRKFGELESQALADEEEAVAAPAPGGSSSTAAAPAAAATTTATTTTADEKKKETSGKVVMWIMGTLAGLIFISTLMNSGSSDANSNGSNNTEQVENQGPKKKKKAPPAWGDEKPETSDSQKPEGYSDEEWQTILQNSKEKPIELQIGQEMGN